MNVTSQAHALDGGTTDLSSKETDHLVRSTKKQKASSHAFTSQHPLRSYKDTVILPNTDWEPHQTFSCLDDDDANSDIDQDNDEPYSVILLSSEEKKRTRAPWRATLIFKAFGKSLGYKYLNFKVCALWKPEGDMQVINLSLDYFLIRFKLQDDYWRVFNERPWFIGQQFLSISN